MRMEKRRSLGKLKILNTFLALERDLIVGGQAVVEGVMMRTPSAYAIACRKSDGEIVTMAESLPKWSDKYKWLSWPVLRGGATLIQSLGLGVKALNFSAKIYEDDLEAHFLAQLRVLGVARLSHQHEHRHVDCLEPDDQR